MGRAVGVSVVEEVSVSCYFSLEFVLGVVEDPW